MKTIESKSHFSEQPQWLESKRQIHGRLPTLTLSRVSVSALFPRLFSSPALIDRASQLSPFCSFGSNLSGCRCGFQGTDGWAGRSVSHRTYGRYTYRQESLHCVKSKSIDEQKSNAPGSRESKLHTHRGLCTQSTASKLEFSELCSKNFELVSEDRSYANNLKHQTKGQS
jgi:hypothetical protein